MSESTTVPTSLYDVACEIAYRLFHRDKNGNLPNYKALASEFLANAKTARARGLYFTASYWTVGAWEAHGLGLSQ